VSRGESEQSADGVVLFRRQANLRLALTMEMHRLQWPATLKTRGGMCNAKVLSGSSPNEWEDKGNGVVPGVLGA